MQPETDTEIVTARLHEGFWGIPYNTLLHQDLGSLFAGSLDSAGYFNAVCLQGGLDGVASKQVLSDTFLCISMSLSLPQRVQAFAKAGFVVQNL